MSSISLQN